MIYFEDWFIAVLYWILSAVAVATEIAMAKHRTATYLWMRLSLPPIFKYITLIVVFAAFAITVGTYSRAYDVPLWLMFAVIAVFNIVTTRLHTELENWACLRMLDQFTTMYPYYCPICVFVHYGLRRGWCKPGVVLPGHDEVHKRIAQESMKAAEKRVAESERV